MMRRVVYSVMGPILLILAVLLLAATFETIKRQRAVLREGPGSFFPAVAELEQGTEVEVIEEADGWYKINVQERSGYISQKATQGETRQSDVFEQLSQQPSVTTVSRSGVSAAVKGFAERYATRLQGEQLSLEKFYSYQIDVRAYQDFKQATYRNRNLAVLHRRIDRPAQQEQDVFWISEEGLGYAIASKIAEMGLYENKKIQDYVNYVGNLVAEASGGYDIPFRFFILDTDNVNAYSCPGGIVFISRGALERMQNEAELAVFLGHEIGHVALRHGMQELDERRPMVTADNAFMELEQEVEMSDQMQATSDDLETMAVDIYETIFEGRLAGYEDEADIYGMISAARAGYQPDALVSYLQRLNQSTYLSGNQHYTTAQNIKRLAVVREWVGAQRLPERLLVLNQVRFRQSTAGL